MVRHRPSFQERPIKKANTVGSPQRPGSAEHRRTEIRRTPSGLRALVVPGAFQAAAARTAARSDGDPCSSPWIASSCKLARHQRFFIVVVFPGTDGSPADAGCSLERGAYEANPNDGPPLVEGPSASCLRHGDDRRSTAGGVVLLDSAGCLRAFGLPIPVACPGCTGCWVI